MAFKAFNTIMNNSRTLILDCRTKSEFKCAHIKGSVCVAVTLDRHGKETLEEVLGPGPPTWSTHCWWDKNILLIPSAGDGSSKKRKRKSEPDGFDDPVKRFLLKEGLVKSLTVLRQEDDSEEHPVASFAKEFPFLMTKSLKAASIPSYPAVIIPGLLYLGNLEHAMAESRLNELKISHILTIHTEPLKTKQKFLQLFINLADESSADIAKHFEEAVAFIEGAKLAEGRILVHCGAGASRSATLCAYYLMKSKEWRVNRALEYLKEQRTQVQPNEGFLQSLYNAENEFIKINMASREGTSRKLRLSVLKDKEEINSIELNSGTKLKFGRSRTCDVVLDHDSISREHGSLVFHADCITLMDLGSVHGTFVNKKRLPKAGRTAIAIGDVIKFGASTRSYILKQS